MADREPVRWITVKGKHLPVYEDGSIGVGLENAPDKLTTPAEVDDMLMELSDDDFRKQIKARGTKYFGQDFGRELNAFLASDDVEYMYERPDFQAAVKSLDNAMVALSKDVQVERYVNKSTLPGFDSRHPENLVGKTIHTPGYLSTTIDAHDSKFEFSNYPAKVILTASKGSKAILGANNKEAEILFHRNSKYDIISYQILKNQYGQKQIVYKARLRKDD